MRVIAKILVLLVAVLLLGCLLAAKTAGKQPFREGEGFGVFRQRNLAHGGGYERIATLLTDQLFHLRRAPAFQREDTQSLKPHVAIIQGERLS